MVKVHFAKKASSPRTRRYFPGMSTQTTPKRLFSAHAEVFPFNSKAFKAAHPLLRARGGISKLHRALAHIAASSPRTRRYFLAHGLHATYHHLFSAHAEVFPRLAPRTSS